MYSDIINNISKNSCCAMDLIRNQLENKKTRLLKVENEKKRVSIEAKDMIFQSTKKPIKSQFSTFKQVFAATLTIALSIALISDISRLFRASSSLSTNQDVSSASFDNSGPKLAAWASWIGAVPTAAELYGDAASEMPTTESFDDDEDDEELDASASNEYPDNDNEADESYEDPDEAEQESEQESSKSERWIKPIEEVIKAAGTAASIRKEKTPAQKVGGNAIWSDLEGWRRNKRDLEDRILLASRRAAIKRRADRAAANDDGQGDEFNVDDGDEDSWVNDGVDDINIDPETKKAANELSASMDDKSIDAEYDPHQKPDESKIVNRTRITTIAEVIPMNVPADFGDGPEEKDSTRINSRFLPPSSTATKTKTTTTTTTTTPTSAVQKVSKIPTMLTTTHHLLPASHLSIDQAQELVAQQAEPQFWSSSSNIRTSVLPAPEQVIDSSPGDNQNRFIKRDSLSNNNSGVGVDVDESSHADGASKDKSPIGITKEDNP